MRFRPLNKAEHAQAGGGKMCISDISGSSVCIASDSGAQHNFSFDRVFTTTSTQTEVSIGPPPQFLSRFMIRIQSYFLCKFLLH